MLAQNCGDRFEIGFSEYAAGRILRAVENQQLRFRRNFRFELSGIKRKIAALTQIQRHRHRAMDGDLRFINRKSRYRINHLVTGAVIGCRQNCVSDKRLGARANNDVIGRNFKPAHVAHISRNCRAQFRNARTGRVSVLTKTNCLVSRLLHVGRRRKVRLPNAEAGDVVALSDELVDFSEDYKSVFGTQRLGAAGEC